METKRKSTGAEGDDRASKRQKTTVLQQESRNGETTATTTQVGLAFLEQIRRTGDKSGRRVAKYFEELLPKDDNKEYYKVVRMPISLSTIETKLRNGDFATLAELESYVKRMVQNAKDYYPRSSHTYDDAERIRKATSNFMVKHNPAYKLIHGYSALPTPIPDELLEESPAEDDTEEDAADGEADSEAADEDEDAGPKAGEDDEEAEEGDGSEEDEADDEDAEGEDDDDARPASRRPHSTAASRDASMRGRRKSTAERASSVSAKPDHEYDGVPYKGLSFQQAQEKIVEEVIRCTDDDDEGYAYFEPFLNLPPRSLKDYFQLIKDPLSLKKLQKLVKGIRSRSDRSGVSEFKNWAAFEEKTSLLWENAYFYNEENSPIANMAKELEIMFRDEIKKAKEFVSDPPQPKIKIKMPQGQETPAPVSKKITIHVANARGGSTESPGPKTGGSAASVTGAKSGGAPIALATHSALDKTRSTPGVSPSPSAVASTKQESSAQASPAPLQRSNGVSATMALPNGAAVPPVVQGLQANGVPGMSGTPGTPGTPQTNGNTAPAPTAVVVARPAHESKFREPGREPLITNLAMRTHPTISTGDRLFELKLPPHPKLTQRSVTLNIPQGQWRHQLIVSLAPSVQQQQRPFKLFVIANGATLGQSAPLAATPADPAEAGGKLYEVNLHPGVNVIQVQVIAGLPKSQSGAEAELEKITIFANLMRY